MVCSQWSTRTVISFCFLTAISLLIVFSLSISIQPVVLKIHLEPLIIEPPPRAETIIQRPQKDNRLSSEPTCFARVKATLSQERLCPRLRSSLIYGEVFPINCNETETFSVEQDCKYDYGTCPVYCKRNNNVTGITFSETTTTATTAALDPHFHQCSKPEQYMPLEMPNEWSYYQLIDQAQRLCGLRTMHCEFISDIGRAKMRKTNCSYDELRLPEGSLARAIGDRCAVAKDTKKEHDEIFRNVVQERHAQLEGPGPTDVVIHVRIGDVVDHSHHSVRELLEKPRTFYPDAYVKTVYVKPYSYYDKVIPDSVVEGATVHLVGGTHAGFSKVALPRLPIKSCMYVQALQEYFLTQRKAKNVKLRLGQTPDDDVLFITQSKQFVRGGGGFSRVMGELVQGFGGTVLGREND